jgi:hypothetical protein
LPRGVKTPLSFFPMIVSLMAPSHDDAVLT